ncbi:hypothetical protein Gpo141_00014200 [Globisporangium polare]
MIGDEDEYDLEVVEAQLARMQRQRQQRSGSRPPQPSQPQHYSCPPVKYHVTTSEFELNEADLSHGSESESEDNDCDSVSTNSLSSDDDDTSGPRRLKVAKKPKATRLRDSLDLSMSIAELSKSHKVTVSKRRSKPSVDYMMHKPELVQEHPQELYDDNKSRSSDVPGGNSSEGKTRSSGGRERAADNEDDVWTSSLVRRRRQLEKEAALAKDQHLHIVSTAPAATEPRFHAAKTRDPLSSSNITTGPSQLVRPTAAGNIFNQRLETERDFGKPDLLSGLPSKETLDTTPPAQMVKQKPRPEQVESPLVAQDQLPTEKTPAAVKKASLVKKPSQSSSSSNFAPSSLKPPERYSARAPIAAAYAVSVSSTTTPAQRPTATPGLEHEAKSKGLTGIPARAPEMSVKAHVNNFSKSSKANGNTHRVHFAPEDHDDGEDLLSVEEVKLRQSLEKLDSRLTKLSSDTRLQQHKSSKLSPQDSRVAPTAGNNSSKAQGRPLPTTNHRRERSDDERTPQVADFADNDVVAAGAYGGGAHVKSGQVTSALERSCYTRRAEMSSGLHKLRVRTGGATAQESNASSANLDKDGTHKVVVKRDLAHLLF